MHAVSVFESFLHCVVFARKCMFNNVEMCACYCLSCIYSLTRLNQLSQRRVSGLIKSRCCFKTYELR